MLCFPCFSLCLSSGLPANIQLDIDGDRETERIYSLFNLYMSKLEKMQGKEGQDVVQPVSHKIIGSCRDTWPGSW